MRTQQEIIDHFKSDDSMFGFGKDVLLEHLQYDAAKEFLKEDFTSKPDAEELWNADRQEPNRGNVLEAMRSYMEFAWGKVVDHRGISANRSVDNMLAWLWLLNDDAITEKVEAAGYEQYGAPKLAVVCEAYDIDIPIDEGLQNMIAGKFCEPGCGEGCGT